MSAPRPARWGLKEALIALYLLFSVEACVERLAAVGLASAAALLYIALFAILLACLLMAAWIRNPVIRWSFAAVFFVAAVFLDSHERITGEFLLYESFVTAMSALAFAAEAFGQFHHPIALALAAGLALLFGLGLEPRSRPPLPGWTFVVAPIAGVALLTAVLHARGAEGGRALPPGFTTLAYAKLYALESSRGDIGPRQEVSIARAPAPARRDVILVIDESVGGNYLDINTPGGIPTGLADPGLATPVHNFGYATSITNCSDGTNAALRFGGTRADYRRMIATMPSAWQYARKAGMRTVYIDAQRVGGRLHNLMTREELSHVDRFVQFDAVPVIDRDMAAADAIAGFINDDVADFVIVNKMGAHFPVNDKYPDAFLVHAPALPRGRFVGVSDAMPRVFFGAPEEEWMLYRNSYRNTLLWNVGEFFKRLLSRADMERATVIYTSDHGQNLHDKATRHATHCSTADPVMEEGVVPLVVLDGSRAAPDWAGAARMNRDRASHYNIFPTLLLLMGYDEGGVAAVYGDPLTRRVNDEQTFNYRFHARHGVKPAWKKVEVARIRTPPLP